MQKDKDKDNELWEVRKASVQGTSKYERCKAEVSSEKQSFDESFTEGTFEPIFQFADSRHLVYNPDNVDDLIELVRTKYPRYMIINDKNNILGVKIPDLQGGSYRYREGARESTNL